MSTYLLVILEFFKTGLFAIGGGLATIPFLREMAERYPWFSLEDLLDMIAVSESTPGPMGINMATYAGYNAGNIGDIDLKNAIAKCSAYTPVPGGVGPMTISSLIRQTVESAERKFGITND